MVAPPFSAVLLLRCTRCLLTIFTAPFFLDGRGIRPELERNQFEERSKVKVVVEIFFFSYIATYDEPANIISRSLRRILHYVGGRSRLAEPVSFDVPGVPDSTACAWALARVDRNLDLHLRRVLVER